MYQELILLILRFVFNSLKKPNFQLFFVKISATALMIIFGRTKIPMVREDPGGAKYYNLPSPPPSKYEIIFEINVATNEILVDC
jgi:hypothetical protein